MSGQMSRLSNMPLALIIRTPFSRRDYDLCECEAMLSVIAVSALEFNLVPYIDETALVLVNDCDLSEVQMFTRQENLQMLASREFAVVHISGHRISEYVREVIRLAHEYNIEIYADVVPQSALDRYIHFYGC